MNETLKLGLWVRRFLLEHVVGERNLALSTQRSYRDTLALLIPFVARTLRKPVDTLTVCDVGADLVRSFLQEQEQTKHWSTTTRNQRLAGVRAFARFVANGVPNTLNGAAKFGLYPSSGPRKCR